MEWKIADTASLDRYGEDILRMYEDTYRTIGLIDYGGWDGLKNYLNCSCYLLVDSTQEKIGRAHV